jgi:hypothetical protein
MYSTDATLNVFALSRFQTMNFHLHSTIAHGNTVINPTNPSNLLNVTVGLYFEGTPPTLAAGDKITLIQNVNGTPANDGASLTAGGYTFNIYIDGSNLTAEVTALPVCQIDETGIAYANIADAIADATGGQTITMLDDHNYSYNGAAPLAVNGKIITIDLNGYTVNIENDVTNTVAGLDVINGELNLQGSGELNVKGYNGIYANNGKATVTNAEGDAYAVMAYNGSEITVTGNATGGNFGVEAQDATVTVAGNVEGDVGINALDNATVTVAGNVEGTSAEAVIATTGAKVYIEGTITGDIKAGGTTISAPTSNVELPPPHNGYYWNEYTDGTSFVYNRQGAIPPPTITTASLAGGTIGATYNQTLVATGGIPIIWSIDAGNLPDGLSLNPATGAITGTPTAAGTFNVTVRAANGGSPDATQTFSITIRAATSSVTSIPTLNSAGLAFLALLLGGLAFWQRRFGAQG